MTCDLSRCHAQCCKVAVVPLPPLCEPELRDGSALAPFEGGRLPATSLRVEPFGPWRVAVMESVCPHLVDERCDVYETRPRACRERPRKGDDLRFTPECNWTEGD